MSGPSIHRAMCKKVACLECDSLETRVADGETFTGRLTTFITRQFMEDFERRLFYDSTMQPGRKVGATDLLVQIKNDKVAADWLDHLMEEMAADD